jgi:hypothetical protein
MFLQAPGGRPSASRWEVSEAPEKRSLRSTDTPYSNRTVASNGTRRRVASMNRSVPAAERTKAAKMFSDGGSQAEVMRACGVGRSTASRWHALWKKEGDRAFCPEIPGFGLGLTIKRLQTIERELQRKTRRGGFTGSIADVAEMIDATRPPPRYQFERLTGTCPRATAFRVLKYLGWNYDGGRIRGRAGGRARSPGPRRWLFTPPSLFRVALQQHG